MTTTAGLTEKSQAMSQAVALSSRPSIKSQREQICQHLIGKGEEVATDEEVPTALAMNTSAQRPRRGEFFPRGEVASSGRRAFVWGAL